MGLVRAPLATLQPTLVFSPHPLLAAAGRTVVDAPFLAGESIQRYLDRVRLHLPGPVILCLNDREIPRDQWAATYPRHGDLITVRARVQGGGGDANKVLRTVAMIAVIAYAGPLAGSITGATEGFAYSFTQGLVAVGGMLVVNALLPPPLPALSDAAGTGDESPTYALTGGVNRGRPYQPLPLVIGQHRIFPDLGARTYTEFLGEDQYLYQVFNFGLSDVALTDFRIGNTPLASDSSTIDGAFTDIELEEAPLATGALTLFPANVDTISGAALTDAGVWVERTSSIAATGLAVDLTGFLFYAGNSGIEARSVTIGIEYRAVGAPTWSPFVAGGEVTLTQSSRKPLRVGYQLAVAQDQYDVRVRRVSPVETDERATSDITWSQLRTYQPDGADYSGQKRLAFKGKASAQFQGQVEALSALASASCEVWTGAAWAAQATGNPAWWFRWLAKGGRDANGRRLYGAGLADARLDEQAIKDWGAWCDTKGLACNLVFDRKMSVQEMLMIIARCGRASPTWASGKLGVVWDEDNQPAVAVFGMANIVRGSFRVEYATGKLADEIVGTWINPALDWQPDTVRASVPGVVNPVNPVNVELFGVTDEAQAGQEVLLLAAAQEYRRRRISWEADFEGLVAQRGDVVTLSHDLTQWGASGRLVAGTTTVLALDREVTLSSVAANYCGVRFPDGSYGIYDVVYAPGSVNTITLATPLPSAPDADANHPPCDYLWLLDPQATPGKKVKIVDIRPLSESRVRVTAVDEDPAYYAAESNPYTYTAPTTFATQFPALSGLEVSDTLTRVGPGFGVRVALAWEAAGDYGGAWVRYRVLGEPWVLLGSTTARSYEFDAPAQGIIDVEVTGYNGHGRTGPASMVTAQQYTIIGKNALPSDVANFAYTITETGVRLTWDEVADVDIEVYELRLGASWGAWSIAEHAKASSFLVNLLAAGSYTWWVKARDTSGNYSTTAVSASFTIDAPAALTPAGAIEGEQFVVIWAEPVASFPIVGYELRSGATWAGGTPVATIKASAYRGKVDWYGDRTYWVVAIDAVGNESTPTAVAITANAPGQPAVATQIAGVQALISWSQPASDLPIIDYELRHGADWASGAFVATIKATAYQADCSWTGTRTYWVAARNAAGIYGTPGSAAVTINAPAQPATANAFSGEQIILSWEAPTATLPIAGYELRFGADWASGAFVATLQATSYREKVAWASRTYWVAAFDAKGNIGTAAQIAVEITPPGQPTARAGFALVEVIDNNVLLRWTAAAGALPIAAFEIRKGAVFAAADVLQQVDGNFCAFFESEAGTFTYWIAAIDSAGNVGPERSISAIVNEPPDYVLQADWFSDFSGTKVSALIKADGDLLAPVPTTDTYEQHFVNNGFGSPQAQVDAGYPYFMMPSGASGSYEQTFDYGVVLPATLISVAMSSIAVAGSVTVTPTISTRTLPTDPWDDNAGVWQLYATNFQYVKVKLDLTAAGGDDLIEIEDLEIKLNVKLKNDAGDGTAAAGDPGGTSVSFNKSFLDITSITVTPKGTSAVMAVYDFVDAPNPTGFSVYLFDQAGARVSGGFSWAAKGY